MRDLIILPSWLVVNPSEPEVIEPEVTEPFWDPWFGDRDELTAKLDETLIDALSDEERSDEVTERRGVDCQCAICLGGSN